MNKKEEIIEPKKKRLSHIFGVYYLDIIPMNYILKVKSVSKSGSVSYKNIGYYTNIKSLMRGLKEEYVMNNLFLEDYDEIIKKLEEINRLIIWEKKDAK